MKSLKELIKKSKNQEVNEKAHENKPHKAVVDEARKLEELKESYASKERYPLKRPKLDQNQPRESTEQLSKPVLTEDQIRDALRKRGEPIKLFGETRDQAFSRLQILHVTPKSRNLDLRGSVDNEEGKKFKPIQSPYRNLQDIPRELSNSAKIRSFIKWCLYRWRQDLDDLTKPQLDAAHGVESRNQLTCWEQTRKDLRPLLKKVKDNKLESEISEKLGDIIDFCMDREYVRAHDKYIELSIGNAAWPMGVTMVGIHERVGRSKIYSSGIAHILNDETTRKYIQMIKRLMTLCQKWYPTDPSRMVAIATS